MPMISVAPRFQATCAHRCITSRRIACHSNGTQPDCAATVYPRRHSQVTVASATVQWALVWNGGNEGGGCCEASVINAPGSATRRPIGPECVQPKAGPSGWRCRWRWDEGAWRSDVGCAACEHRRPPRRAFTPREAAKAHTPGRSSGTMASQTRSQRSCWHGASTSTRYACVGTTRPYERPCRSGVRNQHDRAGAGCRESGTNRPTC